MTCNYHRVRSLIREGGWCLGFGGFGEQRGGRGRQQPLSAVFNKINPLQRGGLISVFIKLGEGGGLKINHLSLFVSALGHSRNDSHVGFLLIVPCRGTGKAAGNQGALAEKQQRSARAARQTGLSSRCVCVCSDLLRLKPG